LDFTSSDYGGFSHLGSSRGVLRAKRQWISFGIGDCSRRRWRFDRVGCGVVCLVFDAFHPVIHEAFFFQQPGQVLPTSKNWQGYVEMH
jgi:hypothetical protein